MSVRLLRFLLAAALGAAVSLLVACGQNKGLIPGTDASRMKNDLDQVASATAAGDCQAAESALTRAEADFQALPASVDVRLRRRLADGLALLAQRVPVDCANATSTTTTPTTATETTTTETTTTETTTTPTTTTTTPTTTTPTTSTPTTTTTTPQNTGGASPGGGG